MRPRAGKTQRCRSGCISANGDDRRGLISCKSYVGSAPRFALRWCLFSASREILQAKVQASTVVPTCCPFSLCGCYRSQQRATGCMYCSCSLKRNRVIRRMQGLPISGGAVSSRMAGLRSCRRRIKRLCRPRRGQTINVVMEYSLDLSEPPILLPLPHSCPALAPIM